jgi:predicted Zn-dependent protease
MFVQNLSRILRLVGVALVAALFATCARAYDFITDDSGIYVVTWNPGTVSLILKMPAPASPLTDGSNYNSSVQAAIQAWNVYIGTLQLTSQIQAPGTATNGNGINEIVMDSKTGGEDFGTNVLAVTLSYSQGDTRVESDLVFNTAYTWDSYRGPRNGRTAIDIRRVAIHELGHVLGLDHPDEASPPQTVAAIMNSKISDIDTMQPDDIAGAQVLYGAPGFVPANNNFANATPITLTGATAQVTGTNVGSTKEAGEPNHAGNTNVHSVWWKWTPASSGSVTITTLGSNFDTVLGVYTGSTVSSLTQVAANDDVEAATSANNSDPNRIRTSTVTFTATAGTTYYIAVDGWDGAMASIVLNLSFGTAGGGTPPSITTQPANQTTTPGGSASFTVAAGGNPTGYQWSFNGSAISGATSATYTLNNVQSANAGNYQVSVSNSAGTVTSSLAMLTVVATPLPSAIVTTGHDVAFSATDTGGIQWQVSSDGGKTWTDLSNDSTYRGVSTSTLEISGATAALNGQLYRYVTTLSGGSSTSNSATLTVAKAFFPFPVGLVVDASGNLYVTDTSTDTVQKIFAGSVTTFAGTSGQTGTADGSGSVALFNDPTGIFTAADGTLSVTDNANATIRRITSAGVVTTLAGSTVNRGNNDGTGTAATFSSPIGIGQDAGGNLYVADATNNTIRKISSTGVVTTFAGSAGIAGSVDGIGTAARFNHPTGIAVDASGNVYVSDSTNNTIRKITSSGAVSTLAGLAGVMGAADGTGTGALFNNPGGLAVDASGNIYLADTGNSAVRKITPAGVVRLLAGLPGVAGLKDGSGSDAWFNQPKDVTVDSSGSVYVADTGNATIRKVSAAGVVTTLALTQGAAVTTTPTTPPPSTSPTTPAQTSSGGGGGGGEMNGWVAIALGFSCLVRWTLKLRRRIAPPFPG